MSMFLLALLFSFVKRHFNSVFELEIDPSTESISSLEFPPAFVSFTRLILFDFEWNRSKAKGKPPRAKAELMTLKVMKKVLEKRLEEYATTLDVSFPVLSSDDVHYTYFVPPTNTQEDEQTIMSSVSTFSANKRNALILRVGEKRILHTYLKRLSELLVGEIQEANQARHGKRKAFDNEEGRQRKRKY
jgi:SET domain-containing protein 6